jgi:hypothetical protein
MPSQQFYPQYRFDFLRPRRERQRKKPRGTVLTPERHQKQQRQNGAFNHADSSGSMKLFAIACWASFHMAEPVKVRKV